MEEQFSTLAETYRQLRDFVSMKHKSETPQFLQRLKETYEILTWYKQGKLSVGKLEEVLTTSDFPLLFGTILQRELLEQYQALPVAWPAYARQGLVNDFRPASRLAYDGLDNAWVPQYQDPEVSHGRLDNQLTERGYTAQVSVYSKSVSYSWQSLLGDDLGLMSTFPSRLAAGARRAEDKLLSNLYIGTTGPSASVYSAGNTNIINIANGATVNNPALSIAGLENGIRVASNQVDSQGEPIMIGTFTLVVPRSLQVTAMNILNAMSVESVDNTATAGTQRILSANWVKNTVVSVVVNPYADIIPTSNGDTSWYLFATPSAGAAALELTLLRGKETPTMYRKASNMLNMAGGLEQDMGDFDTLEHTLKGIHVLGATMLDPRLTFASNGTNA